MNEQNQQQPQPRNIFEVINQNVFDMSQDYVKMFQLMQGMENRIERLSAKIDKIHAALYPAVQNEIPNDSPKDPGEEKGFENE